MMSYWIQGSNSSDGVLIRDRNVYTERHGGKVT